MEEVGTLELQEVDQAVPDTSQPPDNAASGDTGDDHLGFRRGLTENQTYVVARSEWASTFLCGVDDAGLQI